MPKPGDLELVIRPAHRVARVRGLARAPGGIGGEGERIALEGARPFMSTEAGQRPIGSINSMSPLPAKVIWTSPSPYRSRFHVPAYLEPSPATGNQRQNGDEERKKATNHRDVLLT